MGDQTFAAYLSHLDEWGEIRDRRLFDEMWASLRSILRRELHRRDLWGLPPGYLGLYGSNRWNRETLEDLTQDCYLFVIHERRRALIAQLRNRHDIYGLIVRNVRSYLFEAQKRHDPIGFRIFELLQIAARQLMSAGDLVIVDGDRRIRNNTIMEFSTLEPTHESVTLDGPRWQDLAAHWCDRLLPEMITVRGHAVHPFQERLQEQFRLIPSFGIRHFRFGDLIHWVRTEARRRWTSIEAQDLSEANPIRSTLRADEAVERRIEAEQYRRLLLHLEQSVDQFPGRRATRVYLRRLLTFLCDHAAKAEHPENLPSTRRLAETLRIPRERVNGLFSTLRDFAEQCNDRVDGVGDAAWPHLPGHPVQERASP